MALISAFRVRWIVASSGRSVNGKYDGASDPGAIAVGGTERGGIHHEGKNTKSLFDQIADRFCGIEFGAVGLHNC
jgi:hypothetical protein